MFILLRVPRSIEPILSRQVCDRHSISSIDERVTIVLAAFSELRRSTHYDMSLRVPTDGKNFQFRCLALKDHRLPIAMQNREYLN